MIFPGRIAAPPTPPRECDARGLHCLCREPAAAEFPPRLHPISYFGWWMVVSGGCITLANSMLSKPTSEISSGTVRPLRKWPAPSQTPSGRCPQRWQSHRAFYRSSFCASACPPAKCFRHAAPSARGPCRSPLARCRKPRVRSSYCHDGAAPTGARFCDVRARRRYPPPARRRLRYPRETVENDRLDADWLSNTIGTPVASSRSCCDRVNSATEFIRMPSTRFSSSEFTYFICLSALRSAVAQYEVASTGARCIFGPARQLGKKRIADIADNQRQGMRSARHQAAGHAVDPVMQPVRHRDHHVARLRVHAVTIVQGARHGGDIDARFARHIFNRDRNFSQTFPIFLRLSPAVKRSPTRCSPKNLTLFGQE